MPLLITAPAKKQKENACRYAWVNRDDDPSLPPLPAGCSRFSLMIDEFTRDRVLIWSHDGLWHAWAQLKGKTYRTERRTLEDVFKSADRLIYKNFPHVWTSTNCRVILDLWAGNLNL